MTAKLLKRFRKTTMMHSEEPVIKPLKDDINILLLGPTGVGKTTFINGFANYLVSNTLDEAIKAPLQVVIPAWFTFLDPSTFEEQTIVIGKPDNEEKKDGVGESCTRTSRSFVFPINGRKLRLIDTPGVGDTQGPLQDEKNFEDILAFINQYKHLNGICILLEPNQTRLNTPFRFCVKELFRHLHVNTRQNLMFVFTNARKTFFRPGESAPLIRSMLQKLRHEYHADIPFNTDNTFFLENEAFRFLALCKNGVEINPEEQKTI